MNWINLLIGCQGEVWLCAVACGQENGLPLVIK